MKVGRANQGENGKQTVTATKQIHEKKQAHAHQRLIWRRAVPAPALDGSSLRTVYQQVQHARVRA